VRPDWWGSLGHEKAIIPLPLGNREGAPRYISSSSLDHRSLGTQTLMLLQDKAQANIWLQPGGYPLAGVCARLKACSLRSMVSMRSNFRSRKTS